MTGKVGGGGSIVPNRGTEPVVIPNESKTTHNGINVSKTDGMPMVQQAKQPDAETSPPVPEKSLSVRKVLRHKVQDSLLRRFNNAKHAVSRMLAGLQEPSGTGRFEKRLRREVFSDLRMLGLNRAESTSEKQLEKNVKKAVALNKKLIRQQGDMLVKAPELGDKQRVKDSPVTDTKDLGDFLALEQADKENIANCAMLCDAAYQGFDPNFKDVILPDGCTLLKQEELPTELQMLYDDATGLIHAPDNAKAMVVRKGNAIVVVFAGTEPGSKNETGRSGTIKADITQWLGMKSPMYRSAVAVFDLLLKHEPLSGSTFGVAGHSLGGGVAQFAYTAVQDRYPPERFEGVITINSAGLSQGTLDQLGEDRVEKAKGSIQHIRIKGDPVSPSGRSKPGLSVKGQLIGSIMTLPDPEKRGISVHKSDVAIDVIEAHLPVKVNKDT